MTKTVDMSDFQRQQVQELTTKLNNLVCDYCQSQDEHPMRSWQVMAALGLASAVAASVMLDPHAQLQACAANARFGLSQLENPESKELFALAKMQPAGEA